LGQSSRSHGSLSLIQVSEYFADHRRVFAKSRYLEAMLAMIRTSLPHSLQDVISILNIRFNLCAQVIDAWRSAGVWSGCCLAVLPLIPLPRLAGVTIVRYLLLGANTPWKRVRWTLGLGTKATSLETVAPAHPCAHDIPFVLNIKSSGSNITWVVPLA
jgi:hypothetical protein